MELPIAFVLFLFCFSGISSLPKNSDVIPKDFYKRQILQPIPGYIPVYIKTEEEPLVRRQKVKLTTDVEAEKIAEVDSAKIKQHEVLKAINNNEKDAVKNVEQIKIDNPVKDVKSLDNLKNTEINQTKEKQEKVKTLQDQ